MEDEAYDIMAQFWVTASTPLWAECTLDIDRKDLLIGGDYTPVTDMNDYSNFFEVKSFEFSMSNQPEDSGGNMLQGNLAKQGPAGSRARAPRPPARGPTAALNAGTGAPAPGSSDPYHRWRSAKDEDAKKMRFQLSFDSFKLTRVVDGGSPTFFQNCAQQVTFTSASLVKRVSLGGTRIPQAFMRFDFSEVMLKSVRWDDGDMVTESCEFICEEMTFRYRQQEAGGRLKEIGSPAKWSRKLDSKREEDKNPNG